jgi:beta-glucosidase
VTPADERAAETEAQLTDDERFSLLVSVMGTNAVVLVFGNEAPMTCQASSGSWFCCSR